MKKQSPKLNSDAEAEAFIAHSDLTEYDLSGFRTVKFEFQPKTERVYMRLPKPLLDAVKVSATKATCRISATFDRFWSQLSAHPNEPSA